VSSAKTAELIEMPFGLRTRVGPGNHVLDGGPDTPMGKGNFEGERGVPLQSGHYAVICAKTAEPIEMPFGLWARMGPRNHVLDGFQIHRGKGQFWWKGAPTVKYRDTLRSSVVCSDGPYRNCVMGC